MSETTVEPTGLAMAVAGQYVYELEKLDAIGVGPGYTDAKGKGVQGERMIVALVRQPAGSVTERHRHPNEQWMYIIGGSYDGEVDGTPFSARPGSVIYIPSNLPHGGVAGTDGDLVFFTVKDSSFGIRGVKDA
jgi:quercetin dioxygenase-like cupin family protein